MGSPGGTLLDWPETVPRRKAGIDTLFTEHRPIEAIQSDGFDGLIRRTCGPYGRATLGVSILSPVASRMLAPFPVRRRRSGEGLPGRCNGPEGETTTANAAVDRAADGLRQAEAECRHSSGRVLLRGSTADIRLLRSSTGATDGGRGSRSPDRLVADRWMQRREGSSSDDGAGSRTYGGLCRYRRAPIRDGRTRTAGERFVTYRSKVLAGLAVDGALSPRRSQRKAGQSRELLAEDIVSGSFPHFELEVRAEISHGPGDSLSEVIPPPDHWNVQAWKRCYTAHRFDRAGRSAAPTHGQR